MCYVCKKKINGYDHFQTLGCSLFNSEPTANQRERVERPVHEVICFFNLT
jgi:hypothetical protein